MGNVKEKFLDNEFVFYIAVSIGMAVSTTSFTVVSGIFEAINGFGLLLSIALGGFLCILISRQLSELSGTFPSAPGIRTYILHGFGNKTSLFFTLLYLFFVVTIGSVESYMFAAVIRQIFPSIPAWLIVTVIIAMVVTVNLIGIQQSRRMQILTAFLLVIGIAVLGIWGIVNSNASISSALFDFTPSNFTERFITSIGISVFLYVGFEWVAPVAYNSAAFTYKIPRAMQIAILINIVMFSLFCLGTMLHVPVETIVENGVPQVSLAGQLLGNTGLIIALVLSVFAIISTFNAGLMGGARLLYGIAREGILPGSLTRTTASGTPATSIIALSILVLGCSILAIEFELSLLFAIIGSVIICFVYACSLASLLRIRKKQPGRKFRYESRIPVSIQYFLIALLFIFGVMSIFSIPKLSYSVLIYIGAFALTSYVSTHLLLKRKAQSELNNLQR